MVPNDLVVLSLAEEITNLWTSQEKGIPAWQV
jgi:hypothetical protein